MPEIANEDLLVKFTPVAVPPGETYAGDQPIDTLIIVPIKATKAKANNKFICVNNIACTFATATACPYAQLIASGYTFVNGKGSIAATSTKILADSQAILLKGDTGTCTGSWISPPPASVPFPCNCTLEISDAGQTKVKGV